MHRATPFSTSLRAYTAGGARSVVESVDDSKLMQEAKGNFAKGEIRSEIESPQNYGFTSVCADGEKDRDGNLTMGPETFVSFPGGNRSFPAYGPMDDRRHRLKELGKDAAKGSSAMFGLKEWGQQFLNTDTGMFMTGNTEKKIRVQLVDNQNGKAQQQQPTSKINQYGRLEPVRFRSKSGVEFEIEVRPYAGSAAAGGNGQGQQQAQGSKPTGQKTLHKEESTTYHDITKDAQHLVRGKGQVKLEDSKTHTYHEDVSTSTRCDPSHTHIRKKGMKIWVSAGGCHATVPITIVSCSDDDNSGDRDDGSGVARYRDVEKYYLYPPQPSPYDVTSSSPPIEISNGNVAMVYQAPIGLGTGTTPPLTLKYVSPLMLDAGGSLTVDLSVLDGGTF